uniref:(California timema) hypothetical protein n=1 Tax=Timema californicum TaxID=61474 RepID=A0A7R9PBB0_TIMCA|nr:unnamed protein product [Timema californicum]
MSQPTKQSYTPVIAHGSPQWIELELPSSVLVDSFTMQFQGGFTGKDCEVVLKTQTDPLGKSEPFYPEDVNSEVALRVSHSSLMSSDRMKPGWGDWAVTINFL